MNLGPDAVFVMIVIGSVFLFLAVGMRHELKRKGEDFGLVSAPENRLHRWLWNIWQRYVTKRVMRNIEDFTDWAIIEEDGLCSDHTQTDSSGDSSDEHMDVVKHDRKGDLRPGV